MDLPAKLQLKPEQQLALVLAPPDVVSALSGMSTTGAKSEEVGLIVFVADRTSLEKHRKQIAASAQANRLTWVSYPKAGQLETDLNRDSLASLLAESDIQPVRQVAINEVWSALRFRPA
jgi:hypothetical protein